MTVTYGKDPLEDSTGTVLMWVGIGLGIFVGVICIILFVVWMASGRNDDDYIRFDDGNGDTVSRRSPWRPRYDDSAPYQPRWDQAPRFAQPQALPAQAPRPSAPQAPAPSAPQTQAFGARHQSRSLRTSRSSLQSHL
jgi:hypothetical protein